MGGEEDVKPVRVDGAAHCAGVWGRGGRGDVFEGACEEGRVDSVELCLCVDGLGREGRGEDGGACAEDREDGAEGRRIAVDQNGVVGIAGRGKPVREEGGEEGRDGGEGRGRGCDDLARHVERDKVSGHCRK